MTCRYRLAELAGRSADVHERPPPCSPIVTQIVTQGSPTAGGYLLDTATMPQKTESFPSRHLSLSNPAGPGQDDVLALLRRVADSIEELGQVWVQDLVLHNEVTADGDWCSVTVSSAGARSSASLPHDPATHHDPSFVSSGRPVGSVRIRDLGRLSAPGRRRLPSSRPVAVAVAVDSHPRFGHTRRPPPIRSSPSGGT